MRNVLTALAVLLMILVIGQFFLAGAGAVDGSGDFYDLHRHLGSAAGPLALLTTILAALLRAGRRVIGLAGLAAALSSLQFVIAIISDEIGDGSTGSAVVFGLHAINGLLLMAVSGTLVRSMRPMATYPTGPVARSV